MRVTVSKINLRSTYGFSIYETVSKSSVVIYPEEAQWLLDSIIKLNELDSAVRRRRFKNQSLTFEKVDLCNNNYGYGISDYYSSIFITKEDMVDISNQLRTWLDEIKLMNAVSFTADV